MRGNSSSTFSILIAKAQGRKEDRHNVFNPALTPPTAAWLLLPISEYKATDIPSDQRPDRMATPALPCAGESARELFAGSVRCTARAHPRRPWQGTQS